VCDSIVFVSLSQCVCDSVYVSCSLTVCGMYV